MKQRDRWDAATARRDRRHAFRVTQVATVFCVA